MQYSKRTIVKPTPTVLYKYLNIKIHEYRLFLFMCLSTKTTNYNWVHIFMIYESKAY